MIARLLFFTNPYVIERPLQQRHTFLREHPLILICFGFYALKDLEIASTGIRPNTRYGIMLDKNKIEIVF